METSGEPTKSKNDYLLSNYVISFVVFEELVHFDDIRMILDTENSQHEYQASYNLFEDINLVEKHAFLVVVHGILFEDFDGPLNSRLLVHNDPYFSKSA